MLGAALADGHETAAGRAAPGAGTAKGAGGLGRRRRWQLRFGGGVERRDCGWSRVYGGRRCWLSNINPAEQRARNSQGESDTPQK